MKKLTRNAKSHVVFCCMDNRHLLHTVIITREKKLYNLLLVALLAIHDLRSVWSIRRFELMFAPIAHTRAAPKLAWQAHIFSPHVATIVAQARCWDIFPLIEIQLWLDDVVVSRALDAF